MATEEVEPQLPPPPPPPIPYDPTASTWWMFSRVQFDDMFKSSQRSADRSGRVQQIARLLPEGYDPANNLSHFAHHGRLWEVIARIEPTPDTPHGPTGVPR